MSRQFTQGEIQGTEKRTSPLTVQYTFEQGGVFPMLAGRIVRSWLASSLSTGVVSGDLESTVRRKGNGEQ